MKNIFTLLLITLGCLSSIAQAPEKMSYQAIIRNSEGHLVSDQIVNTRIAILHKTNDGNALYVEKHNLSSNLNGLITLEIGAGTIISGSFIGIDWSDGPYYVRTDTDIDNDSNYDISSSSQLLSVPYAIHAKSAENFSGNLDENDPDFNASVASEITLNDITYWNDKLDEFNETDPLFSSSAANGITPNDINNWNGLLLSINEVDPVFIASIAYNISAPDIMNWNSKLSSFTEADPLFSSSPALNITHQEIQNWNDLVLNGGELDPVFSASIASGITATDISNWDNNLSSYTETDPIFTTSPALNISNQDIQNWNDLVLNGGELDPVFGASIASGITALDILNWNNKLTSFTETDPIFIASPALSISNQDIQNWNNLLLNGGELDPVFVASIANGITALDITNWNNKLDVESDTILWKLDGNNISYTNGFVGIGEPFPYTMLTITDILSANRRQSMDLFIQSANVTDEIFIGGISEIRGTSGINRGLEGLSSGISNQTNNGVTGWAEGGLYNDGLYGAASELNSNTEGFNLGTHSWARNSNYSNIAVAAFADIGTNNKGFNFGVSCSATSSTSNGVNYGIFAVAANGVENYAGYFDGDVVVIGNILQPSDEVFKTDIQSLSNTMALINQLNPVTYKYKNNHELEDLKFPNTLKYGLIAQELEKVFPQLVETQSAPMRTQRPDKNGLGKNQRTEKLEYKAINYVDLIPILIQGIKEQQTQIEELEAKISSFEARLSRLEK